MTPRSVTQRLRHAAGSLKLRITLAAMVTLALGIGLTTLVLMHRAEQSTLADVREREVGEAARAASRLSRRVVQLQQTLRASATRISPETLANPTELKRVIGDQPVLMTLFTGLFVARADGSVPVMVTEAGVAESPALRIDDRDYFRRAMREGRPVVSDVVPSRLDGAPLVVFAQPLVAGDTAYGLIAGTINLRRRDLLSELVDATDVDDVALRVVTDASGTIIGHPDPGMLLKSMADEPRLRQAGARWALRGSPVEPSGLVVAEATTSAAEGEPGHDLVSLAGVAGPDWLVWRAVDRERLLGPLHAARTDALGWAVAMIALGSLAVLWGVWALLRPLHRLQRRAEHLFESRDDGAPDWPRAGGEIGQLVGVLRRVGRERMQLEATNTELLRKLGSVMSNAPVGIAFTRARRFELVSAEFDRLLGRAEGELLGQEAALIYESAEDYAALGPKVAAAFQAGQAFIGDVRMRRADGSSFWAHLRGRPVDAGDSQAGTIWTVTDVTEAVDSRAQLEWSAHHDLLTGLANRKNFELRLGRCFDHMPDSLPAALVMIDLDRFKPVNDLAGHAAGDAMLQSVADAIRACIRHRDLAARLGGDEFALLLEACPRDAAMRIADDVLRAIHAASIDWDGQRLNVGASLGVATLTEEVPSVADWLRAADDACYAAKAAGRGQVVAAPLRSTLRVVAG